ncbi:MAG: hypothetical protein LQ341_006362 [Variospora aurantia]|nr:MAG: hypothetical protein LQ341_006362 [Variospora aurantia]
MLDSLRGKDVLSFITTLILDHQLVPAKLLREVLQEEPYNVRILSIRDASCLDEDEEELLNVLQKLIHPLRPGASPKLKGLYCFGQPDKPFYDPTLFYRDRMETIHVPRIADTAEGVTTTAGSHLGRSTSTACAREQIARWTGGYGTMFEVNPRSNEAWARLMIASKKTLAFDTVVCRHGPDSHVAPRVADISLGPEGCQICHSAPENALIFGQSPVHELPLLAPTPLFASTVKAAQSISPNENAKFYARCTLCMRDRRCSLCNAWWCENCYTPPSHRPIGTVQADTKVYLGLCVQNCLVGELYSGAGEGGMWG